MSPRPERAPGLVRQAGREASRGRLTRALGLLRSAAVERPGDASILWEGARACLSAGDRGLARGWLERACELEPPDPRAALELGRIYLERGLTSAARALAARLRRATTEGPEPDLLAAWIEEREGRSDAARARVGRLVTRFPDCHQAFAARARLEAAAGAWDRARLSARRALLVVPSQREYRYAVDRFSVDRAATAPAAGPSPRSRRGAGTLAAAAGARAVLRRAGPPARPGARGRGKERIPAPAPGSAPRLEWEADLQARVDHWIKTGQGRAGAGELLALSTRYPREALVWSELSRLYEASGETRRALGFLRRARQLDPGLAGAGLRQARLLLLAGRVGDAGAALAALPLGDRERAEGLALGGEIELARGEVAAARTAFEAALGRDPGCHPARRGLAEVLERTGELLAAELELGRLVKALPAEPGLWLRRAALLDRMGRGQDAQRVVETGVARDPASTTLGAALARRLLGAGRVHAAERCYRELVRVGRSGGLPERLDHIEALLALRRGEAAERALRPLARRPARAEGGARLAWLEAWLAVVRRAEGRLLPAWQRAIHGRAQDGDPAWWFAALTGPDAEWLAGRLERFAPLLARGTEARRTLAALTQRLRPACRPLARLPGPA